MIEVVTVWTARPEHPKFRDYMGLLQLQRASVLRAKHRHIVVTDGPLPGFELLRVPTLPGSLMHAILEGQIAFLDQWNGAHPVVLADIDVLICHHLARAFTGDFDVALTSRPDPMAPIQNGAMYFAPGSKAAALAFLRRALELCGEHWGGDQEAIARAVAPVPESHGVHWRFGVRFAFLSCENYNHSPKRNVPELRRARFVEHFKGESKRFAETYAREKLGIRL